MHASPSRNKLHSWPSTHLPGHAGLGQRMDLNLACWLIGLHRAKYNAVLKCTDTLCPKQPAQHHTKEHYNTANRLAGELPRATVHCCAQCAPPPHAVHLPLRSTCTCTLHSTNSTAKHIILLKHYSYRTLVAPCTTPGVTAFRQYYVH
jgi:hypothetical protein